MVGRKLLKKHFCKAFVKISAVRQQQMPISTFSIMSIETISCHSNQRSVKIQLFVPPPIDAICDIG